MVRLEQDGTGDTSVYYMLTGSHDFSTGIDNTDNNFKFAEGADLGTNTRMTIQTSTGNVGIGTTAPGAKLDIIGNQTIRTTGANPTSEFIEFDNEDRSPESTYAGSNRVLFNTITRSGNTRDGSIMYFGGISAPFNAISYLLFSANTTLTRPTDATMPTGSHMVIDSNGNVGIGTTNPSSPLNVYVDNSDTTAPMVRLEQDGTGDTSVYYMLTGSHDFSTGIDNTDNNFKFAEGADLGTNTRMTIQTSTGNVGIGTASPNEKLQIDGNFTSETNATDSIGTLAIQWLNGFFVDLFVSNDLEVGGDVNVTGYIGGKNYVTQYHKNATIDTTSADTWVNISWDLTIDEETTSGYSLTDSNVSITIENTGIYRIQGCLHPKNNGVGNQEASLYSRILINEVEAKCLQFANSKEFKTTGIDTMPFTGTLYAEAGQKVQLQYYVTSTNIDFEGDSVFDDGVAGSINFERISK